MVRSKRSFCCTFSVILSLAILVSAFSGVPVHFYRQKHYTADDVLSFAEAVCVFNKRYDDYADGIAGNSDNIGISTNRLIVKTDKELVSSNSIDSFYGLGYQIFQYSDMDSLNADKELFSAQCYDFCNDSIITASDFAEGSTAAESEDMWSYEHLNIDKNIENCVSKNSDEIVIGVIDSGIDKSHQLFDDRIINNHFNFSSSGNENDCTDDYGHGTSVSGVIARSTPSNVKIKPYKFLNNLGKGTVAQFIAVAEYILAEKDKPDILNLSFGAYNFNGEDLQAELCNKLANAGITVVLSSGNDNLPTKYLSPAGAETAITVGAYDCDFEISKFSNYGEEIDVAAPGENIYTACLGNKYCTVSGTSVAAPFVSSACAYVLMNAPKSTPDEIKKEIKNNSIYMGEDEELYFGSGMLSITNIVNLNESPVKPDLKEAVYNEPQMLSFDRIPDNARLIYTTDLSVPTPENGLVYSNPLTIDNDVQINYALIYNDEYMSDIKSCCYSVQYYADESDFKINLFGVITSYTSDKKNIIVPDKINGITPVEIGKNAFSSSSVTSVVIPDTVKKITYGFENLTTLKHVTAKGAAILTNAFSGCTNLRDEVMPNVTSAGGSFKNCSMLHSVDFGRSLTKFSSSDFEGTGLVSLDVPNAVHNLTSEKIFSSSTLVKINLPSVKKIGDYDFAYCKYLQEINAPNATALGPHCFDGCTLLKEFDASNIEILASEALSFCYIDTFIAPKVRAFSLFEKYLTYSYIRVVKLPNITGVLDPKCFDGSYVEELYLDNITLLSDGFKNSENLKVLYLPKCTNYIDTKTSPLLHGDKQSPLQVLWVPSCKELTYDGTVLKLLFAPSLTSLNITNADDASIVVSENLKTISISSVTNNHCRIYAPKGSVASRYATDNHLTVVNNENAISILFCSGDSARFIIKSRRFNFNYFNYANSIRYGFEYDFSADGNLSSNPRCQEIHLEKNVYDKDMHIDFYDLSEMNDKSAISLRAYMNIDGVKFYSPVVSNKIDFNSCCDEHIKVYVVSTDDDSFIYRCRECNTIFSKKSTEVLDMWSADSINHFVTEDSSKEVYYLDVISDGVINAKDFSEIQRVSKLT